MSVCQHKYCCLYCSACCYSCASYCGLLFTYYQSNFYLSHHHHHHHYSFDKEYEYEYVKEAILCSFLSSYFIFGYY